MLVVNRSHDYAFFLRRLCARRILSFLKGHLLEGAAHELERETAVFFDLSHLQYLARRARWEELTSYVTYFIPYPELPSPEASTFLGCIHIYRVLSWIAAGTEKAQDIDFLFPLLDESAAKSNPTAAALHVFYHEVRRRPPRDFAAWLKIWEGAAERLKDLALKCPELKGKLRLPKCAPRRWQINLSGVRPVQRPYKKKVNKQKSCDIACFFKKEKWQEIQKNPSVAGTSGGDGKHGSQVEDNARKSEKRKMSAMLDTDTDVGTRLKARKGSSFAL